MKLFHYEINFDWFKKKRKKHFMFVLKNRIHEYGALPAFCGEHSMMTKTLLTEAGFDPHHHLIFTFTSTYAPDSVNHAMVISSYPGKEIFSDSVGVN